MVCVRFCCGVAAPETPGGGGGGGLHRELVQLPPSCLSQNVATVRAAASQMLGLRAGQLELVYHGRMMVDANSLASYNITAASMIHGFRRPTPAKPAEVKVPGEWDVAQLSLTVKTAALSPAYRSILERLSRPEVLQRLVAAVPALAEDPAAVAILQEPALMLQLTDPAAVHRLVSQHPSLAAASSELASILHDDAAPRAAGTGGRGLHRAGRPRAPPAGSDEDDSGDEEMPAAAPSTPVITRAQLASALAAAGAVRPGGAAGSAIGGAAGDLASGSGISAAAAATSAPVQMDTSGEPSAQSDLSQPPPPQSREEPPAPGGSAPVPPQRSISSEMVSAALREALALASGGVAPYRAEPAQVAPAAPATGQHPATGARSPTQDLTVPAPTHQAAAHPVREEEVRRLLDLGITTNETLIRQALVAADGDIDAAVQILYASL